MANQCSAARARLRYAPTPMDDTADMVIVGAGAAGLMAAVWAGRTRPGRRLLLLDGAGRLGAKILISGGGRCNVTHDQVDASAFAGSSRNAIGKVLRRFDVPRTVAFFREIGVELKREQTGKLFPTTDQARTVLNALLGAAVAAGALLLHPRRVETVTRTDGGFRVAGAWGSIAAPRVVLATGGRSLPKTGSDGHGLELARALGHRPTEHIFPGLVALTLPPGHFIRELSGVTVPATVELWSGRGRRLESFTDSTLCTHLGLSGPSILDISRYFLDARRADPQALLTINWLPGVTAEELDRLLREPRASGPLAVLRPRLPDRLGRGLCREAGVDPALPLHRLTREARKLLAATVTRLPLPIAGDRGFAHAEVTAGGVPLAEIRLETMESRVCPGLHLCGEICDVDGRIGGYNFQWAWASGYTAGVSV